MTNLSQILSQQTTTCHCSLVTPDNIEPGTRTYRVIAHIITNELDPGEQYYAVPMDSQTIDMVLPLSPTDETIWFRTGRQPHASLQRGQTVQVLFSERLGKMTRRLLVNDKPVNQQPEPQPQYKGLTPDTKRAIANYVQDQADLLGFCLKTASEKFSDQVETEESLRSLATTLFIATQRHFGL